MKRRYIILLVLVLSLLPLQVEAQYGRGLYGECLYGDLSSCQTLDDGDNQDDQGEDEQFEDDIDGDGNNEQAIDTDGNLENGYEEYLDPDGSTETLGAVDADGDGTTDFFIQPTEGGGADFFFWDPSDGTTQVITPVDLNGDGVLDLPFDSDNDGEDDAFFDPSNGEIKRIEPNTETADIDGDGNDETASNTDLDDSNGFEDFIDPDGSSAVVDVIDGDGDGLADHLIDTDGDTIIDVYWDPDDDIIYYTVPVNLDDDETLEIPIDTDGNGDADKYYDPDTGELYDMPLPREDRRYSGTAFGGGLYEAIGDFLRSLPEPIIQLLFPAPIWILLFVAGLLMYQARQERLRTEALKKFVAAEQRIAKEKVTFMQLSSHYLRTPLTIISGFTELVLGGDVGDDRQQAESIKQHADRIHEEAETILASIDQDGYLTRTTVAKPLEAMSRKQQLIRAIPILATAITFLTIQFLLIDFRLVTINGWIYMAMVLLAVFFLVLAIVWIRKRDIEQKARLEQEAVIDDEEKLDVARNKFIADSAEMLRGEVGALSKEIEQLNVTNEKEKLQAATNNLAETVARLELLRRLQLNEFRNPKKTLFSTDQVFTDVMAKHENEIEEKNISVKIDPIEHGTIEQPRDLYSYVADSILDNAIDYSPEKSTISINSTIDVHEKTSTVMVSDQGEGMSREQLEYLFKPFSRAEGAENFTHEGMGLSLYLDRIIMHYLGGEISIESTPESGTTVAITSPIVTGAA